MKQVLAASAAIVLALASVLPAPAQWHNKNVIVNSGNGAGNTIIAQNRGGFRGYTPAPVVSPYGYGGGFYPGAEFNPGFVGPNGYDFPGHGGYGFPPFPAPVGRNTNIIRDSGNGYGNTIIARNRGGFMPSPYGGGYGGYPFPGVGGGGFINNNVIINSGNGVGNYIGAFNR